MTKKIISFLLLAAMLFSVLLMSSCKKEAKDESEERVIVLTPKEKFREVGKNASAYIKELTNAFGFDTNMAPVPEGKMEAASFGFKLNKYSVGGQSYISEPISLSGETYSDIKNNIKRTLGKLELNGETVRFEYLSGASAAYFNLDKVTERMLKIPMQEQEQNEGLSAKVKLNEYVDYFMDNFSDDLFTAQSGKVTVDGVEIDAETVTFKATTKQFNEAVIKVLEKAKTDAQIVKLLKTMNINSIDGRSLDDFSEVIDQKIEELKGAIESAKDGDNVVATIVSEKGVLRSFEFTCVENGKKQAVSLTAIIKDSTYYVKGYVKQDENTVIDFSYQQKSNDKGSADGELIMNIDTATISDKSRDTSGDTSGITELFSLNKFTVNATFSGQKTDNKVTIDGKLELSTKQGGLTLSFPVNITVKYEKVSETENKYSANISLNLMGTELDFTVSGGRSLIEYAAAQIPADDTVDVVGENFNISTLTTKFMTAYPGIGKWLKDTFGLNPSGGDNDNGNDDFGNRTGKYIYTENEELTAYLLDDGSGWLCPVLYDVKYADGKYTAKLYDGTEISGKYVQNGNTLVIDDVGGYSYIIEDGLLSISNDEVGSYISFYDEKTCLLETYMEYRIENGKIKIHLSTGGMIQATYEEKGNKAIINGVTFYISDLPGNTDSNT